nr:hypothetical protein [Tanacetum cinerariifolium]
MKIGEQCWREMDFGTVYLIRYLQNEHYALWEVIEFGDSYKAPQEEASKDPGAILKTFGGNEATKKTKKNQLKQQYGNFKAKGSETLEQTFNRLQTIISHLEFMNVEIEQDDLNQKFLTSVALEWLMYTIMWRNRDDIDTMSLDDVYNHLKLYEPKVQKKSEINSQNMAFISSANTNSGKEMDIKWNMALLSMRADKFWKKTGKKMTIKGTDVAGFDKSKVEYFKCHKMGHFAWECRAPRSQDRGRRESYKQGSKEEEPAPTTLMAIDGIGWDWGYMANEEENHALVADMKLQHNLHLWPNQAQVLKMRPSPSIESNTSDLQNSNSSISKHRESSDSIMSKPMIKFVKAYDSSTFIKTNKTETARKPPVKYAEMYRNNSKIIKLGINSQNNINDKGYWDSGCSRHMTGNISYLFEYEPYDGGYVSFGQGGGKITIKLRWGYDPGKLRATPDLLISDHVVEIDVVL